MSFTFSGKSLQFSYSSDNAKTSRRLSFCFLEIFKFYLVLQNWLVFNWTNRIYIKVFMIRSLELDHEYTDLADITYFRIGTNNFEKQRFWFLILPYFFEWFPSFNNFLPLIASPFFLQKRIIAFLSISRGFDIHTLLCKLF